MANKPKEPTLAKLDEIAGLMKHLIAIELWRGGASQDQICKHIHVSKTDVGAMLKGVNRE